MAKRIATSLSVSRDRRVRSTDFVIIGNPGSRRVELFQAALARFGLRPARMVAYADLLAGRVVLPDVVRCGDVVRIESPGRDWEVEKAILCAGADATFKEITHSGHLDWLSPQTIQELPFERGRILPMRQWYLGWCATLRLIEHQLGSCPLHRLMNTPSDIAVMFDKVSCHERLSRAGIPVPRSFGSPASFDDLIEKMRQTGCPRVFIKPAHGSSASGVVAYATDGQRHRATTTVEMVWQKSSSGSRELHLYNSRRIRTYREVEEIADLVDALCRHHVHVEQWLPKAGCQGRTLDLRVVVIAGRAQHTVVRLSRTPLTNLHLLNERSDIDLVRSRMPDDRWEAARAACDLVMQCFPGSLYGGVDLLIAPDYRRHAVLEVNAFGDLLHNVLHDERDTYTAQILATLN